MVTKNVKEASYWKMVKELIRHRVIDMKTIEIELFSEPHLAWYIGRIKPLQYYEDMSRIINRLIEDKIIIPFPHISNVWKINPKRRKELQK